MIATAAGGPNGHQEVWELLPWHANGTLTAEEAERVEVHLERCALCRRELEVCRAMASAVDAAGALPLAAPEARPPQERAEGGALPAAGASGPAAGAPPEPRPSGPGGEASPAGEPTAGGPGTDHAARAGWWAATPRPARRALLALAAALGVVALGLAFLAGRGGWPGPGGANGPAAAAAAPAPGAFRTLADPADGAPEQADDAPAVRLVLRDEATAAEVRRLLAEVGGEIVAGPSPAGVYTVRLGGDRGEAAVAAALDRLRRHPAVLFAEPAVVRGAGGAEPPGGAR